MSIQIGVHDIINNNNIRTLNNENIKLYSDVQSNLLELVSGCNITSFSLSNINNTKSSIHIGSSNHSSNIIVESYIFGNEPYKILDLSKDISIFNTSSCIINGNISIACNINVIGIIDNNKPIQINGIISSNVSIYAIANDYTPFTIRSSTVNTELLSLNTGSNHVIIQTNLGIGTTITRHKLQIQGSMHASNGIYTGYIGSNLNSRNIELFGGMNINGGLSVSGIFSLIGANINVTSIGISNVEPSLYPAIYISQPSGSNSLTTFKINQGNNTSNNVFDISSYGRTYIGTYLLNNSNTRLYESISTNNAMLNIYIPPTFTNDSLIKTISYTNSNTLIVSKDAYIGIGTTIVSNPLELYFHSNTNLFESSLSNSDTIGIYHIDLPNKKIMYASSNSIPVFSVDGRGNLTIGSNYAIKFNSNSEMIMNNTLYVNTINLNANMIGSTNSIDLYGIKTLQAQYIIGNTCDTSITTSSNITTKLGINTSNINTSNLNVFSNAVFNNVYLNGNIDGPKINIFLGKSDNTYFIPAANGNDSLSYFLTSNILITENSNYTNELTNAIIGNSNGILQIRTYQINNKPITSGVSVYGYDYSSMLVSSSNPYYQLRRPGSNTYNICINRYGDLCFGLSNNINTLDYTISHMKVQADNTISIGNSKTLLYSKPLGSIQVSVFGNQPELSSVGGFETKGRAYFRASNTTQGLYIDNDSGNVGIGTTNPIVKLDIRGDALVSTSIAVGTNDIYAGIHIQGKTFLRSSIGIGTTIIRKNVDIFGDAIISRNIGIGTTLPRTNLDVKNSVLISGNVGIGITNVGAYMLNVSSNVFINRSFTSSNSITTENFYGKLNGIANSAEIASNSLKISNIPNIIVKTISSSNITTNNGNIAVGIATVSASVFYGNLNGYANSANLASNSFGYITNGDLIRESIVSGYIYCSNVLNTKNLSILGSNTIIQSYTQVNSNLYINNTTSGIGLVVYQSGTNNYSNVFDLYNNTNKIVPVFRITNRGNIGIGTANSLTKLHVQGSGYHSGGIGIGTTQYIGAVNLLGDALISNNIGIGTVNPLSSLHIIGDAYIANNIGIGTTLPQNILHIADNMILGSNTVYVTGNNLIPSSTGNINGVSITALNSRTRTSYASASNCTNIWYTRSSAADISWQSVCWAPELSLFCAVSQDGSGTQQVMTSTDGVNWTIRNSSITKTWRSICWSPELSLFCAVASTGNSFDNVMTSYNGINWTTRTLSITPILQSVCWSSELNLFCAVGGTGIILTSTNGINWSSVSISNYNWTSVCWSSDLSLFCAVSTSSYVGISRDGIIWASYSVSNINWSSVCWSAELGIFCAVASSGIDSNRAMTSSDGINWIIRATPSTNQWISVCWAPELSIFCSVASLGTSNVVMISKNGSNWIPQRGAISNSWQSICWSPELSIFCSVSSAGIGNRVMNSEKGIPNSRSIIKILPNQIFTDPIGNLGIGTTIVRQKLEVSANVYIYNSIGIGTTLPKTKLHIQGISYHNSNIGIGTTNPRQNLDIIGNTIITNNIGIGTTLPLQSLHVQNISYLENVTNIGSLVVSAPTFIKDTIGAIATGVASNNSITINSFVYKTVGSGGGLGQHYMTIGTNNTVYAWGNNNNGQFGNNTTIDSKVPISIATYGSLSGKSIIAISCGSSHTAAIDSAGIVHTWGANGSGQLGNNSTTQSIIPINISTFGSLSGKSIIAIACGNSHTAAIDSTGSVHTWGNNGSGRLGNNSTTQSIVPINISNSGSLSGKTIVAIACGYEHTVAIDSTGGVHTWGDNVSGQLGNNTLTDSYIPINISTFGSLSGKMVVAIACGYAHTAAIDSTGGVHIWGLNLDGQLGNNSTIRSRIPVSISSYGSLIGKSIIAIACGYSHTVALDNLGYVHSWGMNTYGQLGNNSFTNSYIPIFIHHGTIINKKITSISCGYYNTIALDSSGSVHSFGEDISVNSINNVFIPQYRITMNNYKPETMLYNTNDSIYIGTSVKYAAITDTITAPPSANGRINNVSITSLNRRTQASYGSVLNCTSTWTLRTSAANNSWQSICWAPEVGLFCAVANTGVGNRVMTSTDGIIWVSQTISPDLPWISVCWSPELGLFCAVAWPVTTGNDVMISSDGINWILTTSAGYHQWKSVCWSPELGIFCAVGLESYAMISYNGINWTKSLINSSVSEIDGDVWNNVCWSSELGRFCATGEFGSIGIWSVAISYDGKNWTGVYNSNRYTIFSICWSPDLSIFVGTTVPTLVANSIKGIVISRDGLNWNVATLTANEWKGICWSSELSLFCSVIGSGTGNRVLTSAYGLPTYNNTILALPGQFMVDNNQNVGIGTTIFRQRLDLVGGNMIVSGNIGIGTTLPKFDLHVQGSSYFSSNVGIGTEIQRKALDVYGDIIVSGNVGIGTTTPAYRISIPKGTDTNIALLLTGGTLTSAAKAGSIEYDGNVLYMTNKDDTRNITNNNQINVYADNTTNLITVSPQALFITNNNITVPTGTFMFETCFVIGNLDTTSASFGYKFGGTATIARQSWFAKAIKGNIGSGSTYVSSALTIGHYTAEGTSLVIANTGSNCATFIKGTLQISSSGTLIPQVSITNTPGIATYINPNSDSCYFKMFPISPVYNTGVAIGNWS